VPHRRARTQLKVLVAGQSETGKTLLIKNLFASYAAAPGWAPTDVSKLSAADFAADSTLFQTLIDGKSDAAGHLDLRYIVQVKEGNGEAARRGGFCIGCLCPTRAHPSNLFPRRRRRWRARLRRAATR